MLRDPTLGSVVLGEQSFPAAKLAAVNLAPDTAGARRYGGVEHLVVNH